MNHFSGIFQSFWAHMRNTYFAKHLTVTVVEYSYWKLMNMEEMHRSTQAIEDDIFVNTEISSLNLVFKKFLVVC